MSEKNLSWNEAMKEIASMPGVLPLQKVKGTFLHAIDLRNPYPCHNILCTRTLFSPGFRTLLPMPFAVEESSYRNLPLAKLGDPQSSPGFLTPRAMSTVLIRNDRYAAIELSFEKFRRDIAPEAASRLCCLWAAEDSELGWRNIHQMFGESENLLITQVEIVHAIRITRADTSWFDKYFENPRESFIENYWKGEPFSAESPRWEFLIEGTLKVIDERAIYEIQMHGAKFGVSQHSP